MLIQIIARSIPLLWLKVITRSNFGSYFNINIAFSPHEGMDLATEICISKMVYFRVIFGSQNPSFLFVHVTRSCEQKGKISYKLWLFFDNSQFVLVLYAEIHQQFRETFYEYVCFIHTSSGSPKPGGIQLLTPPTGMSLYVMYLRTPGNFCTEQENTLK